MIIIQEYCSHLPILLLFWASIHVIDVRLVGGPTSNKGTVEISQNNGPWETTCGVNLGIHDVIVICRQLGFTGASRAVSNTPYEHNSTPTTALHCGGGKHFISTINNVSPKL